MITEERLGELLAAIGNHEAKALVFLSMGEGEAYGVTSIYRRFIEIQGSPPAVVGRVSTAQKYIVHSFAPIGLVAREQNDGGFLRHVRDDPDGIAAALAGFLLSATIDQPFSLQRLLGKTPAGGNMERSPIRRYRILRALAQTTGDIYPTALAAAARVSEMSTSKALEIWAEHDLLSYNGKATYELTTSYRVTNVVPPQVGKGNYSTVTEVGEFLNHLLSQSPGEVVVARKQIEAHLRSLPQWEDVAALPDVVQGVMKRLVSRGVVEIVTSHYGPTHATVSMTPEQRAFVQRIAFGIEAIAAGEPTAITTGIEESERILDSSSLVRSLMKKGFAASKLANNPMSAGEKLRLAAEAVEKLPGATTDELLTIVGPRFSVELLRASLASLAKKGDIVAVKQPDGPYRRWYPPDPPGS